MGWVGRTLLFFYQRSRQGAQSPATCCFAAHSAFDPERTEMEGYAGICGSIARDNAKKK